MLGGSLAPPLVPPARPGAAGCATSGCSWIDWSSADADGTGLGGAPLIARSSSEGESGLEACDIPGSGASAGRESCSGDAASGTASAAGTRLLLPLDYAALVEPGGCD